MPIENVVRLHFVLDTNVFIALEPGAEKVEPGLRKAADFVSLAASKGHRVSITQATRDDLLRDKNVTRRTRHLQLLYKYHILERIVPSDDLLSRVSVTRESLEVKPHDKADIEVLAAVECHAAGFVITEDKGLLRWASRASLDEWVLSVDAAIAFVRSLEPQAVEPPPRVERIHCYQLSLSDSFFDSLKNDYGSFEAWWKKICGEDRAAWVIRSPHTSELEALLITKQEDDASEIGLGALP